MAARKKDTSAPSPLEAARAASAQRMALARSSISRSAKQVPVTINMSQHPHVPTGSIVIDNLIGGNVAADGKAICPGFPRRRITEIYGPEASGKTTVALSAVRSVQERGGSAAFLDYEHALDYRYAKNIGVRFDDTFDVYAPDTMEEGFKIIFILISAGVDLIIVDSVAAMMPAAELQKALDDAAKVGVVAAKMAQNLPKIANWLAKFPKKNGVSDDSPGTSLVLLNQERATIATGPSRAPAEASSSGGRALKFYGSVRLRTTKFKTEKVTIKDRFTGKPRDVPYGVVTKVKVVKDKLDGKAGQEGEIFIRYGYGVDDVLSVIEAGIANSIVRRAGATYEFDQVKIVGRDKFRSFLISNPKVYEALRERVFASILSGAVPVAPEDLSEEDEIQAQVAAEGLDDDDPTDVSIEEEVSLEGDETPEDAGDAEEG